MVTQAVKDSPKRIFLYLCSGLSFTLMEDDYNNLDTYNSNEIHDMWVDYDYNENTGDLSDLFED